jgi:hypothetical protein
MKKQKKEFPTWIDKNRCPICNYILIKKYEGMVCKNSRCPLYFKIGSGWVYIPKETKNNLQFFNAQYDFDITRHENLKEYLKLKSRKFYEEKFVKYVKAILNYIYITFFQEVLILNLV